MCRSSCGLGGSFGDRSGGSGSRWLGAAQVAGGADGTAKIAASICGGSSFSAALDAHLYVPALQFKFGDVLFDEKLDSSFSSF